MALKITNRSYSEAFTNGLTDWLLGNVGEWQDLELSIEVSIDYIATSAQPVQIDYINNAFKLSNGKSWGEYGFDNGMTLVFKYKFLQDTTGDGNFDTVQNIQQQFTITNVYGSIMEVSQPITVNEFDSVPINFGSKKISDVKFYVDRVPEGCRVKYGHLTNEDYKSTTLESFIDGTVSEFVLPNASGASYMEAVGLQSGMSIRQIYVTPNGKKSQSDNVYLFDIKINFMISSLFDNISNFENLEIPSYLIGDGSLTDNFILEFYPEWNNPNVYIVNELVKTERLGNTGWFDENFNQLKNDFNIDSIEYFDENGSPVDGLDYASKTKVKCLISGVPNLNVNTECGFGFSWIPTNEEDYKEKETPFYRNLFIQSGMYDAGFNLDTNYPGSFIGAGIDGASMDVENVRFTNLNGTIVFEGTFVPNAEFYSKFDAKDEENRNYIIWMSVADGSLDRNFSDRVSLLADFKVLEKHIPQAGEYPFLENAFVEHPFDDDFVGVEKYEGIVQDDILCRMPFSIKKDGSVYFEKMTFGVEAFNIGLNKSFDLERYEIDLSQSPTDANDVQQFSVDQTRGFKLESGNNKNWVKILRETGSDTVENNGYLAYFATKIRWEDWILNQKTPPDFFDANELNDGFNNDWVHYLRTQGWIINFYTEINATIDGELTQYKNQFKFTFNDYDENDNISTAHRYFRDSDDTLLNIGTDPEYNKPLGVILSNEPTRIEIDFEILDAGVWDLGLVYAVTTIEIDRGAGRFEMRQLSSVWGSEDDNPLKPLTGQTKLKMVVDGTSKILTTSCLIDPDLLDDGAKYRITGRVGCFDISGGIFVPGLYEFRYENLYE